MSLRFVIGRAGAGKTHHIYGEIREELAAGEDGPPIILLVPEQATFRTEREILAGGGFQGSFRLRVLGFRRLAQEVLQSTGGTGSSAVDDLGKRMLLRDRLLRRRAELSVFNSLDPGAIDRLARTISELKRYRISADDLSRQADVLAAAGRDIEGTLPARLADIALILRDMEDYLHDRYLDPDALLDLMAERLSRWQVIRQASIYLDGFLSFTPQEMQVVEKILTCAAHVEISLCLPPQMLGLNPLKAGTFAEGLGTYNSLLEAADRLDIRRESPCLLQPQEPPRFKQKALLHLERVMPGYNRTPFAGDMAGLHLRAAANPRAEAEWIAREIIRLCRDEGLRWRECAVIARKLDTCADLFKSVFAEAGIGCFIDNRADVSHHPLVELLRSAPRVISANWSYEALFACLKTDLFPLEREECDLLENYVLAHGIRGRRWLDGLPWRYRQSLLADEDEGQDIPDELLERVNDIRARVVGCLAGFHEELSQPGLTVGRVCAALQNLIGHIGAADRMNDWQWAAEERGDLDEAQEHAAIRDKAADLLNQMTLLLGDEEIDLSGFCDVLEAALQALDLGIIPPGMDAVVIGAADRSRFPEIKAAFVTGLNDGLFPALPEEDSIFSDDDRRILHDAGLNLAPSSRELLLRERYLLYTSVTRASHYLSLSYSLTDGEGRAGMPSILVSRLQESFPGLAAANWPADPTGDDDFDASFLTDRKTALFHLVERLRQPSSVAGDGLWPRLGRTIHCRDEGWPKGEERQEARILSSLDYRNSVRFLSQDLVREACGPVARESVSSLERLAACPFSYYAMRLLGLQERPVFQMGHAQAGVFRHAAMSDFMRLLRSRKLQWGEVSAAEAALIMEEVCQALVPRLQNEILLSSSKYRYLSATLTAAMARMVAVHAEAAVRTGYHPLAEELSFGPGGELPGLLLEAGRGHRLELRGRIDRLDMAPDGSWTLLDYKSSGHTRLDWSDLLYGLSLQLPAYALLVSRSGRLLDPDLRQPAGFFYVPLHDPQISCKAPLTEEAARADYRRKLRMHGIFSSEAAPMLDSGLEPGNESPFLNLALCRDGSPQTRSGAVIPETIGQILEYTQLLLIEAGAQLYSGRLEIKPFRMKKNTPCRFCKFKPLCSFDRLLPGNDWKRLPALSREAVLQQMAARIADSHLPVSLSGGPEVRS